MADIKDFGDFITSEYEILKKVFWNLSVTDLESCQEVCKAWKNAVEVVVKQRRTIQCVWEPCDQTSVPFIESDAILVLTFCSVSSKGNYNWNYMTKKAKKFFCMLGTIINIPGKPALFKPLRGGHRRGDVDKVLTSVRFPEWEGVNLYSFRFAVNKAQVSDITNNVDENVPKDVEIKAVIMLTSNQPGRPHALCVIEHLRNRQENFPFAGCYNTEDDPYVYCYIFWGPNVHAKSCVLNENICNETKVCNRLEAFSQNFSPKNNGVMFVFSCLQRDKANSNFSEDSKDDLYVIEKRALDKFFPDCNRIGCFSAGELGMDCPEIRTAKRRRMDFYHSFSTILMYIWYD